MSHFFKPYKLDKYVSTYDYVLEFSNLHTKYETFSYNNGCLEY